MNFRKRPRLCDNSVIYSSYLFRLHQMPCLEVLAGFVLVGKIWLEDYFGAQKELRLPVLA